MKKKDKTKDKKPTAKTAVVDKPLLFYKDGRGWFADVEGHTQAQNVMVAGADKLIEGFSGGKPGVMVRVSADCEKPKPYLVRLRRIEHDPFGATYLAFIKGKILPRPAWLCNVTHTVFGGEHPKRIYIHEIQPVDDPQPKTKNQSQEPRPRGPDTKYQKQTNKTKKTRNPYCIVSGDMVQWRLSNRAMGFGRHTTNHGRWTEGHRPKKRKR